MPNYLIASLVIIFCGFFLLIYSIKKRDALLDFNSFLTIIWFFMLGAFIVYYCHENGLSENIHSWLSGDAQEIKVSLFLTLLTAFVAFVTAVNIFFLKHIYDDVERKMKEIARLEEKISEVLQGVSIMQRQIESQIYRFNKSIEYANEGAERVFNLLAPRVFEDSTSDPGVMRLNKRFTIDREQFLLGHSDEDMRLVALAQLASFLRQEDYRALVRTDETRRRIEWMKENDESTLVREKAEEVLDLMWQD